MVVGYHANDRFAAQRSCRRHYTVHYTETAKIDRRVLLSFIATCTKLPVPARIFGAHRLVAGTLGEPPTRSRQNHSPARNNSEQSCVLPRRASVRLPPGSDDAIEELSRVVQHGWRNMRVDVSSHVSAKSWEVHSSEGRRFGEVGASRAPRRLPRSRRGC